MSATEKKFDVALSFATEDMALAREIYEKLRNQGLRVFFYPEEKTPAIGEDLKRITQQYYAEDSHFVVLLISKSYEAKKWTMEEFRTVQRRALLEESFLIPVIIDAAPLQDLNPDLVYWTWNGDSLAFARQVREKLVGLMKRMKEMGANEKGKTQEPASNPQPPSLGSTFNTGQINVKGDVYQGDNTIHKNATPPEKN